MSPLLITADTVFHKCETHLCRSSETVWDFNVSGDHLFDDVVPS